MQIPQFPARTVELGAIHVSFRASVKNEALRAYNLEKRCRKMERLLVSLTNMSLKDLERNDFCFDRNTHQQQQQGRRQPRNKSAIHSTSSSPPLTLQPTESSDSSSSEEDDDDEFAPASEMSFKMRDYDSIKYTGHSAGLQLVDHDIFKSKPYICWPGRDDLVIQMMAQDELMIVRTSESGKTDVRLDVGLSMRSAIFDQRRSHPPRSPTVIKRPANHMLDKMIGLYFSHYHSFLPIINESKFMDQYRHNNPSPPTILVWAILALAFRYAALHFKEKGADEFADLYFRKVMKRLRDPMRSRLCYVQVGILMTLYLDMDEGDVESIQWFTLGTAIRMAQDLGLHRSCAKWKLPLSEIETRHRVFHACYVLDRWMGARAGKPLTILDRDFDTAMPSPYKVTDAGPSGEPIYRHFLLLIKLSEILGRVLKALYAPKAKRSNCNAGLDDPTILVVLDRRLKNWRASLDEPMDGSELPISQKVHLQVFYNTIVLLLHRPFIQLSPVQFPDLQSIITESRRACADAAGNISSILRQHKTPPTEPNLSFCLPTCFVYAMFQSSLVHLSNLLQDRLSVHNQEKLEESLSLLKLHNDLCSAPRAIEILQMLITINEISPAPSQSQLSLPQPQYQYQHQQQMVPRPSLLSDATPPHPIAGEEYPKSGQVFEQRMINCSVLGGITSDIRPDVTASISSHAQASSYFLPQPETSQLSMNFYHQPQRHQHHLQHHPSIESPPTFIAPQVLQHQHSPVSQLPIPPGGSAITTSLVASPSPLQSPYAWNDWSVFLTHSAVDHPELPPHS
ncbi:fungal-specific transcription factor domain-containing protein [Dichotomocladium elegans]|nr:fungal-specific transcription factor domain-containing protein [Dichotomocladium elegans]